MQHDSNSAAIAEDTVAGFLDDSLDRQRDEEGEAEGDGEEEGDEQGDEHGGGEREGDMDVSFDSSRLSLRREDMTIADLPDSEREKVRNCPD